MDPTSRSRVYGKRKGVGTSGYAVSSIFSSTSPTKARTGPIYSAEEVQAQPENGQKGRDSAGEDDSVDTSDDSSSHALSNPHSGFTTPLRSVNPPERKGTFQRTGRKPTMGPVSGKNMSITSVETAILEDIEMGASRLHITNTTDDDMSVKLQLEDPLVTKTSSRNIQELSKPEPKPKQKHSPLTSTPHSYFSPLLQHCASRSARRAPLSFASWADSLDEHFTIRKIAEASFGEVFRLCVRDRVGTGLTRPDESVLKILAVRPPVDNGADKGEYQYDLMSEPESILSEIQLLKLLSPVPGFTNFRDLRLLTGRPPPSFSQAWRGWNDAQSKSNKSCFPDWGCIESFPENQIWAIIEMQDAGFDLEAFVLRDVWSVWDLFWGIVLAVAKAEGTFGFEHRDMHLGNICANIKGFLPTSMPVSNRENDGDGTSGKEESDQWKRNVEGSQFARETAELLTALSEPLIRIPSAALDFAAGQQGGRHPSPDMRGKQKPARTKLHFTDIFPTIIDYSISRAELDSQLKKPDGRRDRANGAVQVDDNHEGSDRDDDDDPSVAFINLSIDHDVFLNDGSVHYQYDMYRFMRSAAFLDDPFARYPPRPSNSKATNSKAKPDQDEGDLARTWRGFHPQTNLVWLHFILRELMLPLTRLNRASDIARLEKRRKMRIMGKDGCEIDSIPEQNEDGKEAAEKEKEEEDAAAAAAARRRPKRAAATAAANAIKQSSNDDKAKRSAKRANNDTPTVDGKAQDCGVDVEEISDQDREKQISSLMKRIRIVDDRDDISPASLAGSVLAHGQYLEYALSRVSTLLSLQRWSEHAKKTKRKNQRTRKAITTKGSASTPSSPSSQSTQKGQVKRESMAAVGITDVDDHGPILRSAGDLVAIALREGWLDERDAILAE